MAGVRLVTSSPALRGEYLKVQAMTQYSLAEAIAVRIGADPAASMFPADPGRLRSPRPSRSRWTAGCTPTRPSRSRR